jgi:hypothetical protein
MLRFFCIFVLCYVGRAIDLAGLGYWRNTPLFESQFKRFVIFSFLPWLWDILPLSAMFYLHAKNFKHIRPVSKHFDMENEEHHMLTD